MYVSAARSWLKAHCGQASFHATNGLIFAFPNLITTPIFWTLGFTDRGLDEVRTAQLHHRVDPTAILADNLPATHASETMKAVGLVTAGGIYATIQSAAMGGYGVGPVNGAVRAGALTSRR
jgi:hypothetical protein